MVSIEGIEISIQCSGQSLTEYDDPESSNNRSGVKYVEAVAGATFSILVTLTPQFRYYGCNGVYIEYNIENYPARSRNFGKYFNQDTLEVKSISFVSPRTGGCTRADLMFGTLVTG